MARMMLVTFVGLFLLSSLCEPVQAKGFLARLDEIEKLLDNVKDLLGSEHYAFAKDKLGKIESVLRPVYMALGKNKNGKLGRGAASYALHRLFVQRHGWYVSGLEPQGKGFTAWSTSSPTSVLRKSIPESTVSLLEQQLFKDGFGLHELAIVAATIEHLVHNEAMERLRSAFKAQHTSTDQLLTTDDSDRILDSYMTLYIVGFLLKMSESPTPYQVQSLVASMPDLYPGWSQTKEFVRDVRQSIVSKSDHLSYLDVSKVVEETGERYGRWQDTECRSIMGQLLAIEDTTAGGAGRVRLADFYKLALQDKQLQFTESRSYLRKLGALDESDPTTPRVIITNYLYGPSNCVASSKYYEVCCINQCEDLMGRLEQEVASPDASSEQIATIVGSLSSPSSPAGRKMSPWLWRELEKIVSHHGGRVPLHGRLFAQWMHFAFPRECPYPQISGVSEPGTLADVVANEKALKDAVATDKEMQHVVDSAPARPERILDPSAHESLSLVSMQEEIVV